MYNMRKGSDSQQKFLRTKRDRDRSLVDIDIWNIWQLSLAWILSLTQKFTQNRRGRFAVAMKKSWSDAQDSKTPRLQRRNLQEFPIIYGQNGRTCIKSVRNGDILVRHWNCGPPFQTDRALWQDSSETISSSFSRFFTHLTSLSLVSQSVG